MLSNPLNVVSAQLTDKSNKSAETSAVSNDIAGQCPVCQGNMVILACGNETEAYVCMDDRVAIPVPNTAKAVEYSEPLGL